VPDAGGSNRCTGSGEGMDGIGLTLHPAKTRLVDERKDGFDFLGYHFETGKRWPRSKSLRKFRDAIRAKTKRASGRSMSQTIADVNRTLRGWFEDFTHSHHKTFRTEKGVPKRTAPTSHAGPLPTLMRSGFSTFNKPIPQHVSPLPRKTTDWRAVCGRSGDRHVPFGGMGGHRSQFDASYPYTFPRAQCLMGTGSGRRGLASTITTVYAATIP
jgi:Group II intron, maturase-specific domain